MKRLLVLAFFLLVPIFVTADALDDLIIVKEAEEQQSGSSSTDSTEDMGHPSEEEMRAALEMAREAAREAMEAVKSFK